LARRQPRLGLVRRDYGKFVAGSRPYVSSLRARGRLAATFAPRLFGHRSWPIADRSRQWLLHQCGLRTQTRKPIL